MQITAAVQDLSIGDIQVQSTTFGSLDLKLLATLLNKGSAMGLPYFNIFLKLLPLEFPEAKLFGLFSLSDLHVKYYDNFVATGVTPHFKQPPRGSDWVPEEEPDVPWDCSDSKVLTVIECETEE